MDRNLVVSQRAVRYLLAVAELRSFTRAAETLYVSQPTLSQQIKHLEDSLGVQLLDRSGRTVRLTDAGEVYVRHAYRAVRELEAGRRAINEVKDLSRGTLRVGMTPVTDYLATPLLENFHARYPGIVLSILELSQDEIEAAIVDDRLDVGIAFTNTLSSEARSSEIETQILFIETLNLAVGKRHPYAGQQVPLSGQALEQESLALLSGNFALRRHIDLYCIEHSITPRIAFEASSLGVIVELVRFGRLATVLPKAITCVQSGLYPVMLVPELPHHTITLICRKGAYKSVACAAFGEVAAEWCVRRCDVKTGERLRPCPLAEVCERHLC
jgi:LysR family cyn operon transcriptional activator